MVRVQGNGCEDEEEWDLRDMDEAKQSGLQRLGANDEREGGNLEFLLLGDTRWYIYLYGPLQIWGNEILSEEFMAQHKCLE